MQCTDMDTDLSGRIRFPVEARVFSLALCTAYKRARGPTQPLEVKRPVRAADHLRPSSAEIKNALSCTSVPPYVSMGKVKVNPQYDVLS